MSPATSTTCVRRLTDWLKAEARRELADAARWYARETGQQGRAGHPCATPSSRWGSCSRTGNLSFSWRLIFAPQVGAGLCGGTRGGMHLEHMNHSASFWAGLRRICPRTDEAEDWLKQQRLRPAPLRLKRAARIG